MSGLAPDFVDTRVKRLASRSRIPQKLHRRLQLYCVTHDIVLMHFVVATIEEKLGRKRGSKTA